MLIWIEWRVLVNFNGEKKITKPAEVEVDLKCLWVLPDSRAQRCIQGGDLGVKTPPLKEIFYNLLGFFEKKIPKPSLNFTVHIRPYSHGFVLVINFNNTWMISYQIRASENCVREKSFSRKKYSEERIRTQLTPPPLGYAHGLCLWTCFIKGSSIFLNFSITKCAFKLRTQGLIRATFW